MDHSYGSTVLFILHQSIQSSQPRVCQVCILHLLLSIQCNSIKELTGRISAAEPREKTCRKRKWQREREREKELQLIVKGTYRQANENGGKVIDTVCISLKEKKNKGEVKNVLRTVYNVKLTFHCWVS